MKRLRILYAGSPLASAIVLRRLIAASEAAESIFSIVGVLTNPPSTRGRHSVLVPTEVARVAEQHEIRTFCFEHLKSEAREAVSSVGADILVSFDYGRIFGPRFLSLFRLGGINLHPGRLPEYRGCTPVPAAILNGDGSLFVTVQKLALKTDEGDILAQTELPLDGTETTGFLLDGDGKASRVTDAGAELLDKVLVRAARALNGEDDFEGIPQSGECFYTPLIQKDSGAIDWSCDAGQICRKIRAYTPWPLCFTGCNGAKLLILKASVSDRKLDSSESVAPGTVLSYRKSAGIEIACGNGSVLAVTELQWQAKKAMDYKSFMNGARNFIGSVLL